TSTSRASSFNETPTLTLFAAPRAGAQHPWDGPAGTAMNEQILTQDEVDALLQGIAGESDSLEPEAAEEGGVRRYDLVNQDRMVRERMPALEIINERFAKNIRAGLFGFIRKS